MEILVGSDGSTDNTEEILLGLIKEIPVLKLLSFDRRRGKKFVINDLVEESKGEILVFCDSNTRFKKNAVSHLIKYFEDDRVGGVCGRLILKSDHSIQSGNQEERYWDYETRIKILEGSMGVLIGSNGAIYSIRRELFLPMPEKEHVVDDLYLSLNVLKQQKDFIYSSEAEAEEDLRTSSQDEFKRKIRILPRSLETLKKTKSLLFSKRILVSYCYWSHKVIRWFSPLMLIIFFVTNLLLVNFSILFLVMAVLQIIFYISGIIGYFLSRLHVRTSTFEMIYYFIMTNVALIVGYQRFLLKKHKPTWEPTSRG